MADLRPARRDRSQILLIAAFALAVIFIALALVVNSAIFTENLASRGEISSGSEALTTKHQVERSVGEAIRFANVHNYTLSDSTLDPSMKNSISDIGFQGGNHSSLGGQLVNVSHDSNVDGARIADDDPSTSFTNITGESTWLVAQDVERTRDIVITTESTDLPGSGSPFKLIANESDTDDDVWEVAIWDDSGEAVLDVETGDGDTATCRHDVTGAGEFDIDITGGLVNGERCHALTRDGTAGTPMWFGTGIPSTSTYNITFENGDQITGNYSMVVHPRLSAYSLSLHPDPATGDPYHTDAIYSVTVDYVFRTPQVTYETKLEVAPGEPP